MSTTVTQNFYLSDLEISTTAVKGLLPDGADTTPISCDATAEVNVDIAVMQALFQFHTDASDVTNDNAEDLKYKVVYSTSADPLTSDFLVNTIVTVSPIDSNASSNAVAYDYPRYLAQNLFNTFLGVDLFSNETEIRTGLISSAKSALNTKLVTLNDAGEKTTNDSTSNPSNYVLKQIFKNDADRLSTLHLASGGETVSDGSTAWYYMPFVAGDVVAFKLIVQAASEQMGIINSTDSINDRTYLIKLNVTGTSNAWDSSN